MVQTRSQNSYTNNMDEFFALQDIVHSNIRQIVLDLYDQVEILTNNEDREKLIPNLITVLKMLNEKYNSLESSEKEMSVTCQEKDSLFSEDVNHKQLYQTFQQEMEKAENRWERERESLLG